MTDEKIKPSLIVYEWETQTGAIHHGLTYEPYNGVYPERGIEYYPESALAQAREEGRREGLLVEAKKDAERYRWLREQCTGNGKLTVAMVKEWELLPWSGDDPDAAIDAAIKEQP
jgi:hypothetical protein